MVIRSHVFWSGDALGPDDDQVLYIVPAGQRALVKFVGITNFTGVDQEAGLGVRHGPGTFVDVVKWTEIPDGQVRWAGGLYIVADEGWMLESDWSQGDGTDTRFHVSGVLFDL